MDKAKDMLWRGYTRRKSFNGHEGVLDDLHGYNSQTGDDDNIIFTDSENMTINSVQKYTSADGFLPHPGGPFSSIIPSMLPHDILLRLKNPPEDTNGQLDYRYDEFGFKVEEEDGPEPSSSKLLSLPFIEDKSHRLRWTAHLEFTHSRITGNLTWENIDTRLQHSEKLRQMVRQGIPHSIRPQIWMRLSGALEKKLNSTNHYKEIVRASSGDNLMTSKQIEKDLLRTLPNNACFSHISSTGIPRLRRILRGLAWLYPDIGYCQGTGIIAANLLLFVEEEDTFWLMSTIVEDLLPALYYSSSLIGVQADQRVLMQLLPSYVPEVEKSLREHDIEMSLVSLHWFLTLFAGVVHVKILLRIWDLFFYEGSVVLFQITLGLLKHKQDSLIILDNSAQIFNALSAAPSQVHDVDELIEIALRVAATLNDTMIMSHRKKHLAILMSEEGAIVNPNNCRNLPKQQLNKRQLRRSRSVISMLLWGDENGSGLGGNEAAHSGELAVAKNIKQTELLVDLRDASLQIARHFQTMDPKHAYVSLNADYSLESHARDLENYVQVAQNRRRRAKALLDFERHDDDELGFRKHDIISIVSMRDEHCWIGEINGLRGWFPAKFVDLLDERSKNYSIAGDDSVTEVITDLVRGILCPALKAVLEHGIKRSALLGVSNAHPWLFIEEATTKEVEKDFNSVFSRLVLCKTYRLDEDGKVLTPEELLYRAVQAINVGHDAAHAQMDVKLRSLVCSGLNEQVLHLWFETLCSCTEVVQKWYHPWSFMRSPGWVQIKCELRLLSQFSFNLNRDWELPGALRNGGDMNSHAAQLRALMTARILKEGVRDMLVKHHLFSWELT